MSLENADQIHLRPAGRKVLRTAFSAALGRGFLIGCWELQRGNEAVGAGADDVAGDDGAVV